jgi:hypothetical protein
MHASGHFVLIFDGIDEMRHRMSKEEFLYNIDQIGILVNSSPRGVVLGRPSAFMDEEEYHYVVHGRRSAASRLDTRGGLNATETRIRLLRNSEIGRFTNRYCRWRYPDRPKMPTRVNSVLAGDAGSELEEITTRPLQLMMFLEIFPELPRPLDRLTKATVYSIFIDGLIARERVRQRSRKFSADDQRRFARSIAWWLRLRGDSRIAAKEVNAEVFEPFVGPNDNVDDVRRALISGSFLSTERGTKLHFPHLSIQEFLVAEEVSRWAGDPVTLSKRREELTGVESEIFSDGMMDLLSSMLDEDQTWNMIEFLGTLGSIPHSAPLLLGRNGDMVPAMLGRLQKSPNVFVASLLANEVFRRTLTFRCGHGMLIRNTLLSLVKKTANELPGDRWWSAEQEISELSAYISILLTAAEGDSVWAEPPVAEVSHILLNIFSSPSAIKMRQSGRRKLAFTATPAFSFLKDFFSALEAGFEGDALHLWPISKLAEFHARLVPKYSGYYLRPAPGRIIRSGSSGWSTDTIMNVRSALHEYSVARDSADLAV